MTTRMGITLFILVFLVNTVIAFIYLNISLTNNAYQSVRERRAGIQKYTDAKLCFMIFFMLVAMPIFGPLFFGCGYILGRYVFKEPADLGDAMFSKDRVASRNPADVERDRNMVPMEEALAISDKSSLRTLMMNVLKGDANNYLAAISKALNSDDTETAHYAASVLRDALNDFRSNVQDMYNTLEKADSSEAADTCEKLINYMNAFLTQNVFTPMEQSDYVDTFEEVAIILNDIAPDRMKPEYFEWVASRLLETLKYNRCEYWCSLSMAHYPEELSSYTISLKLYFQQGNKDKFFAVMNSLKESSIVIDKETLELIRTFA